MYTVDRIENDFALLENRKTKIIIEVRIEDLPINIKEGDIIDILSNKYILNSNKTKETNKNVRNKFNKLKNK